MRVTSKLLALALTAALQPAMAGTVPLDFEDITSKDGWINLLDRYDGLGGPGIQFTGAAWGVSGFKCGGSGNFFYDGAFDGGCTALILAGNPKDADTSQPQSFTLNFAEGFTNGSSFYYSGRASSAVTISVFKDVNGVGLLTDVDSTSLLLSGCTSDDSIKWCDWSKLTLGFAGTARSIVISGADESLLIDGLRLIQATAVPGRLPEPGSIALAFGALGALGWTRKRAAR
jgi:hypothetical protein